VKTESLISVCAVVIAVASLTVSIVEARAVRRHDRNSVRPILQLHRMWNHGGRTGVRLINSGLGPAIVTHSVLRVDSESFGSWSSAVAHRLHDELAMQFSYVTFNETEVLPTGYEKYLLSVKDYDPQIHGPFTDLIRHRVELDVHYESLYGEKFMITLRPSPDGRVCPVR
jgi:hypothetical protein